MFNRPNVTLLKVIWSKETATLAKRFVFKVG